MESGGGQRRPDEGEGGGRRSGGGGAYPKSFKVRLSSERDQEETEQQEGTIVSSEPGAKRRVVAADRQAVGQGLPEDGDEEDLVGDV